MVCRRTFGREQLDDGGLERRDLRVDGPVLQLDFERDGAEVREPVQLLVRLEEVELSRICVLDPERIHSATCPRLGRGKNARHTA